MGTSSDVPSLIRLSADGPTGFSGLLVGFPHHPSPSLVGLNLSLARFCRHAPGKGPGICYQLLVNEMGKLISISFRLHLEFGYLDLTSRNFNNNYQYKLLDINLTTHDDAYLNRIYITTHDEMEINGMHFLSSFTNFWIHVSLDYVIIVHVHGIFVFVYTLKDSLILSQVLGSQPDYREN